MQQIYDVIGSMLIGGIVLLMLLGFNSNVMEGSATQTFNSTVQSNLTTLTELFEYDMRKLGYRVFASTDSAITYADSNRVTFRSDIDNNGSLDLVTYRFDPNAVSGHPNPRTRILYRTQNGSTRLMNIGVTRFRLYYYDDKENLIAGNPIVQPSRIRSVRAVINVESQSPYDTIYSGATWQRIIKPKNLD